MFSYTKKWQLKKQTTNSHLDNNKLTRISAKWFSNCESLNWLSLSGNEIDTIEDGSFSGNLKLFELDLSSNRIKKIVAQTFAGSLPSLARLYLSNNLLDELPENAFVHLKSSLQSLELKKVYFSSIDSRTFQVFNDQFKTIYFEQFWYCYYATNVRICHPLSDGLSTAKRLLAFPVHQYAVWFVALATAIGNLFVFIWRSISKREQRVASIFVRNLAIADLLMAIYLLSIASHDTFVFKNNFSRHALAWMSSWYCAIIGFFAILSCELSVFILTLITIERYNSIKSMKKIDESSKVRNAKVSVSLAWIAAICIASYPLVEQFVYKKTHYYASNGLCLPLQIGLQGFKASKMYSAIIFCGINFTGVVVIATLYVRMYYHVVGSRVMSRPSKLFVQANNLSTYHKQNKQQAGNLASQLRAALYPSYDIDKENKKKKNKSAQQLQVSHHLYKQLNNKNNKIVSTNKNGNENREDAILALRFFFIAITDCVCWMPIVIIKLIALFGYEIPNSVYAWLVICIIPFNSAMNPIVYTLAAPTKLRDKICRLFVSMIPSKLTNYKRKSDTTTNITNTTTTTTPITNTTDEEDTIDSRIDSLSTSNGEIAPLTRQKQKQQTKYSL